MSNPPVREGEILDGKYRIERIVGEGSMGIVVAALHLQLDQRVAIKFLHPRLSQKGDSAQRFMQEARAAARMQGEHVTRVLDVGRKEEVPFMVMEYLEGQDLALLLAERGVLPVRDAVYYMLQACEAMAEAHAVGIVHRDLKPANLFLARRPDGSRTIKVLDFGISKVLGKSSSDAHLLTTESMVMGSPVYMSPEQMRSTRDVDERSDIWALGTILYEFLSGSAPFEADTVPQLCTLILEGHPRSLREVRADLPPALEMVIFRCLEKDPAKRYPKAADFAAALLPFGPPGSDSIVDRTTRISYPMPTIDPAPSSAAHAKNLATRTTDITIERRKAAKKRRGVLIASLLGCAILALVGVQMLSSNKRELPSANLTAGAPPPEQTAPQPAAIEGAGSLQPRTGVIGAPPGHAEAPSPEALSADPTRPGGSVPLEKANEAPLATPLVPGKIVPPAARPSGDKTSTAKQRRNSLASAAKQEAAKDLPPPLKQPASDSLDMSGFGDRK